MKKRSCFRHTKDYIHKLTRRIIDDLHFKGVEVLFLEDLTGMKETVKRGKSGKKNNFIRSSLPYSMLRQFLTYKAIKKGIQVEFINPAYTSKTCCSCGSRNTARPRQQDIECLDCGFKIHADLGASRNIDSKGKFPNQWVDSDCYPELDV